MRVDLKYVENARKALAMLVKGHIRKLLAGFFKSSGIDIKTKASEYKPDLILNAIQYERKNPKTYVLVWIRTPKQKLEETEVELVGWIHREDFERKKDSTFINGDHVYLLHKELLNNFY